MCDLSPAPFALHSLLRLCYLENSLHLQLHCRDTMCDAAIMIVECVVWCDVKGVLFVFYSFVVCRPCVVYLPLMCRPPPRRLGFVLCTIELGL